MSVVPGPHLVDDPIARTRMAWVRTVLAVIVLGFLLVRGAVVLDTSPVLAYAAAVVTGFIVATGLLRFTVLSRRVPGRSPIAVRAMVVGGVLLLVGIGLIVTLSAPTP